MNDIFFIKPTAVYEKEYMSMLADWRIHDAGSIPWYVDAGAGFPSFVERLNGYSRGEGLEPGYVENTTFWLSDSEHRILGALNIRHRLNDFLLNFGGQIGYCVRPGERRKGYATQMLRLGLAEARKLGLQKVLLCCYSDNLGSVRVIEANGGELENQIPADGRAVNRYWIQL